MKKLKTMAMLFIATSSICIMSCRDTDHDEKEEEVQYKYFYSGTVNGHDYVDLGLSVKWATYNIGAARPEEYGCYYAWGETEGKNSYGYDTYKWCKQVSSFPYTKYCTDGSDGGDVDNKVVLDFEDDVAYVKRGGNWRMPTSSEIQELCDKCSWQWLKVANINGHKITGPNGNSIFLPATGYFSDTYCFEEGSAGFYWSRNLKKDGSLQDDVAYVLNSNSSNGNKLSYLRRDFGGTVRPVTEGEKSNNYELQDLIGHWSNVAYNDSETTTELISFKDEVSVVYEGFIYDGDNEQSVIASGSYILDKDVIRISYDDVWVYTSSGNETFWGFTYNEERNVNYTINSIDGKRMKVTDETGKQIEFEMYSVINVPSLQPYPPYQGL